MAQGRNDGGRSQSGQCIVRVLWDIENLAVPRNVDGAALVEAIRREARRLGQLEKVVAYGDPARFRSRVRDLERSGVEFKACNVEGTTAGEKELVDKLIMNDTIFFCWDQTRSATDNRAPLPMIVSGDFDFARTYHELAARGVRCCIVCRRRQDMGRHCEARDIIVWEDLVSASTAESSSAPAATGAQAPGSSNGTPRGAAAAGSRQQQQQQQQRQQQQQKQQQQKQKQQKRSSSISSSAVTSSPSRASQQPAATQDSGGRKKKATSSSRATERSVLGMLGQLLERHRDGLSGSQVKPLFLEMFGTDLGDLAEQAGIGGRVLSLFQRMDDVTITRNVDEQPFFQLSRFAGSHPSLPPAAVVQFRSDAMRLSDQGMYVDFSNVFRQTEGQPHPGVAAETEATLSRIRQEQRQRQLQKQQQQQRQLQKQQQQSEREHAQRLMRLGLAELVRSHPEGILASDIRRVFLEQFGEPLADQLESVGMSRKVSEVMAEIPNVFTLAEADGMLRFLYLT